MPTSNSNSLRDSDGLGQSTLMEINKKAGNKQRRSSMGEYLSKPGQKPLTALAAINPGPNAYCPDRGKVLSSAPQYSMPGRTRVVRQADFAVGPSDHAPIHMGLGNRRQAITMASKGQTFLQLLGISRILGNKGKYPSSIHVYINKKSMNMGKGPPSWYKVDRYKTGTNGPKWSFAGKSKANIQPGPLKKFVAPCEIPGFQTPGPAYMPAKGDREGKSFGLGLGHRPPLDKEKSPGPAHYASKEPDAGLAYSLTRRPAPEKPNDVPGSNYYTMKTTIGRTGIRKSFGIRHPDLRKNENPPPNMYAQSKLFRDDNAFKFNFRPFPYELGLNVPGPEVYTPGDSTRPTAPQYSFQDKLKPNYPDILGYPDLSREQSEPGPGRYDDKTSMVESNDAPKYSMGAPRRRSKNTNPAPNHYHLRTPTRPDNKKAPSYSFGYKFDQKYEKIGPGPAVYNLQEGPESGGWTMTGRTADMGKLCTQELACGGCPADMGKPSEDLARDGMMTGHTVDIAPADIPGPNAYRLLHRETRRGPTLRSRHSPYVYSGINPSSVVDA